MKSCTGEWCGDEIHPCLLKIFIESVNRCFSTAEAAEEMGESLEKISVCLANLEVYDVVCRNGNLWCPENPF